MWRLPSRVKIDLGLSGGHTWTDAQGVHLTRLT